MNPVDFTICPWPTKMMTLGSCDTSPIPPRLTNQDAKPLVVKVPSILIWAARSMKSTWTWVDWGPGPGWRNPSQGHITGISPSGGAQNGWFIMENLTGSAAQGGGGSFKNRKPIGEVGCCESRMAERIHWWTAERWLELCFLGWLQWLQWSPHHNCWM